MTWVELCLFQVSVVAETRNQGHSREMIDVLKEKYEHITVSGSGKALAEVNGNENGLDDSDEEDHNLKEDLLQSNTNWLSTGTTFARNRRKSVSICEMAL